jgi:small nuclear ribonucleoprotein (snRNP)-like protein
MKLKNQNININFILKEKKFYPILVELKGGITCYGKFFKIDEFMNLHLQKVLITTKNGYYFKEISSILIKGKMIKLVRAV